MRYAIHKALMELEWLDKHITARAPEFQTAVGNHIEELRSRLLRAMDAATDEELTEIDDDEPDVDEAIIRTSIADYDSHPL